VTLLPLLLGLGGTDVISGDRPGFLNSSTLVGTGIWQVETGLNFDHARHSSDSASLPTALRYGWSEELELRASTSGWNRVDAHGAPDAAGLGPLTIGVKAPLPRDWADLDLHWADSVAWVAELRLPGGTQDESDGSFSPSLSAVASWTASELWQAGATLGLAYEPDDASMVLNFAASASAPIEERTSIFFECGWFPQTRGGSDPLYVGSGLIFLPTNDVQLDLSFDAGLGDANGDWLAGVGLCWRW